jgi:hypothetical protein
MIKINVPVRRLDGRLLMVSTKMEQEAFEDKDFRNKVIQGALTTYGIKLSSAVPMTQLNEEGTEYTLPEYQATK